MNEFTFSYPTKVYFGQDSLEKAIQTELNKYGKTVMLAYGVRHRSRAELRRRYHQ